MPKPEKLALDQTVELFCGKAKAFSCIASALGFATYTVDADPAISPDLVADIRTVTADKMPPAPLIVWARPPAFPAFAEQSCWEQDGSYFPVTPEAEQAIAIVRATINAITALNPTWWFMEHPKSLLRSMPTFAGFNRGYPSRNRQTIRHDEYGGRDASETDVWTNAYWWIPRPGEPDGSGGVDTSGRIPPFVFAQIFEQLDQYQRTGFYGPR